MSNGRHSYVAFYPSDWIAGTAGMPRIVASVYHDICLYNWDKAAAMSMTRFKVMTSDLPQEQAQNILQLLIDDERIIVERDMIYSPRAIEEAKKALQLWEAKSRGGKNRASKNPDISKTKKQSKKTQPTEESLDSSLLSKDNNSAPPTPSEQDQKQDQEDLAAIEKLNQAKAQREKLNDEVKQIAQAWNAMASTCGLPNIESMSDKRKAAVAAHIGRHGLEKVMTAIASVPRSKFLLGKNERNWRASFDPWFIRPDSCAKLIEGAYHAENEAKQASAAPAKPVEPVLIIEGEGDLGRNFRSAVLTHVGQATYCAIMHRVMLEFEPESKAVRLSGSGAVRMKDDFMPALKAVARTIGYEHIW